MAKLIRLSDDDGATWMNLPGSQGAFNIDGEAIDDTILGASYSTSEIGLINWGVSSDGIFKGFPGYQAKLLKGGTPTIADDEPLEQESGQIYVITDPTRRILDRTDTVVVYDNAVDETDNVEWVDYLFGRVKFVDGYSVTGPVTADVSYLPTSFVGRANSYTLTMTADTMDESDFETAQGNNGTRVFAPGLRTVALELGGIFTASENAKSELTDREELIVEIDPAGDGKAIARGFFKITTTGQSGAVGALEEQTITYSHQVPDETAGPQIYLPFNWVFANDTLLSPAIRAAINAWLDEINTTEVQYLPEGTPGQTPLDGVQGDVMFTDISLSGGLSSMNVFNIEMQGTDQYTEV